MVALLGEVQEQNNKAGSLKREFIGEILPEEAIFDAGLAVRLGVKSLPGADLSGANLTRADLTRAYLSGADLTGADLTRVNLYGAYLYGARRYLDDSEIPGWKVKNNILVKK